MATGTPHDTIDQRNSGQQQATGTVGQNRDVPNVVSPAGGLPDLVQQAATAFGSAVRIAMINTMRSESLTQTQLIKRLEIDEATGRNHLRVLRELGLLHPVARRGEPLQLVGPKVQELAVALLVYVVDTR